MKQLVSIFLLGLYVFALFRPLMPLVDYASNYTYYSKVLCVNKDLPELACKGQCVLMQKIKAKAEKENPLNKIVMDASEEIPELLPQCMAFCSYCQPEEIQWGVLAFSPKEGFERIPTPPPQV